jgi:phenol 2-monooxygenase
MQFHLDGFEPGDPETSAPSQRFPASGAAGPLPDEADVLIVGCGPAGLTLAAQLSAFPDIKTVIVDQKPDRLYRGQADGVACRTMEMFEAFGFAERVLREAYWVNETAFWKPDEAQAGRIARSGRIQDVEDGLSEFPHVILNQARVHDFYLDVMRKSPARIEPHYSRRLVDLRVDAGADDVSAHAVTARLERLGPTHEGRIETIRARYVVGCDGARSPVRAAIGLSLHGDSANQAWGVMDVLALTDFPDIRLKCLVQSARDGGMVIIPREGGYLVRLYVEMDRLGMGERVASRKIAAEDLIGAARRILAPYRFEVKEIAWWSVYEIGQRLCSRFDDAAGDGGGPRGPRVFIAGDACHTHSPKAGQGMNVSMQDSFNLGWKLAATLRGRCGPDLLRTYSQERQAIAGELIDFDREWAQMLSAGAKSGGKGFDPAETQRYFVRHGRYTAGTATRYRPSVLTAEPVHQALAPGFEIGTRFHSAPVIRLADARPMHLGHVARADGRWRILAFADAGGADAPGPRMSALCDFLADDPASPVRRFTPADADIDTVIDVRAVFQQSHRAVDVGRMPPVLLPAKGRHGLLDYEKVFCADLGGGRDIFDLRGVDRAQGCVVVVRPDQYVANLLPLDAHAALARYFEGFMRPALRPARGLGD